MGWRIEGMRCGGDNQAMNAALHSLTSCENPLNPFAGCSDVISLRCAIQKLCADAGIVARLDILTLSKSERRQALCFLRVESAAQELLLMGTSGLSRFGSDLLYIADLAIPQGKPLELAAH